jgi:hypothetical protein
MDPAHEPADVHDEHHDHFDPEPITALPDDEPRSPLWLPLVGLLLFVVVGLWWTWDGDEPSGTMAPSPVEVTKPVAVPAPKPTERQARQRQGIRRLPANPPQGASR